MPKKTPGDEYIGESRLSGVSGNNYIFVNQLSVMNTPVVNTVHQGVNSEYG
jgi:hypothetical protein